MSSGGATTVDLSAYFNSVGFVNDGLPFDYALRAYDCPCSYDGIAYSADLLGLVSTNTLMFKQLPFVFGRGDGSANAVCGGGTIPVPVGHYSVLYLVGMAIEGPITGTITLQYTNPPLNVSVQQSFADWWDRDHLQSFPNQQEFATGAHFNMYATVRWFVCS